MKLEPNTEAAETVQTTDSPAVAPAATCSLIRDVARFMAFANARGRFNAVEEGSEKEALISADGEMNAKRWEKSAEVLLQMSGHLSPENASVEARQK